VDNKINILNELKEAGATTLINAGKGNCFSVPGDYFSNLPGNILTHIFINSLSSVNPYTVSETYFEELPGLILKKINIQENIHLKGINKSNIYSVPDDYFNNLAGNILSKIKTSSIDSVQQELEEISPLLSKLPKTNVYAVPQNYFSELDPLAGTDNNDIKPSVKIISMGRNARKWINYAVAACIAAVLFGGGYFYLFNRNSGNEGISPLAKMDVEKEISILSDNEIADYLKDNTNMAVYTNMGTEEEQQQNVDMQNLLQNVSDEEIQQYLDNDDSGEDKTGEGI
jgi:hypothetical protein